jgi:hypothetical protein
MSGGCGGRLQTAVDILATVKMLIDVSAGHSKLLRRLADQRRMLLKGGTNFNMSPAPASSDSWPASRPHTEDYKS